MTTPPASQSELPERDRELLSAYIDNELPAAERAALEQRLAHEPALCRELAELRATRDLLRDQPWVKPPRSFTLTPEMAGIRQRRFTLPAWWQSLSGLAALVLVMVVGWQLLAVNAPSTMVANPVAAPPPPSQPEAAVANPNRDTPPATDESVAVLEAQPTAEAITLQPPPGAGHAGAVPETQRQTPPAALPGPPPLPIVIGLALLIVIAAGIWWIRRNAESD